MPLLVLLVTDAHNADGVAMALPPGTVYTTLQMTEAEWQKTPASLASEYLLPIVARSQQQWAQVPR